jgi:malate dehydrogenase
MTEPIRVAVTGAAGRISYALLFRIAAGGMFGSHQPVALSLLDVPENGELLADTTVELRNCVFPMLAGVRWSTDAVEAFDRADWIIMLASAPVRPEMSRTDLIRANAPTYQEQGRAINESAPCARVLVVANPCNSNCQVARSFARDVPQEHWFAMTRLDQNRAHALLAEKAGVPVDQVSRVTVWGNHSSSVFPDFHNAYIGDRPAPEVINDPHWVRDVYERAIARRGTQVLRLRGASPAGAAAQAILASVRSITTPTPLLHRFSAAVVSDGSYGVPRDLVFGFPLRTEDGKTRSIVQNLFLDAHAQERLAANVAELGFEASIVNGILGTL